MDMDDAKLDGLIEEKNEEISAAEKHFETELEKLQNTYKKLSEDKDASIAAVKDSGLGMMKAVKAAKAKAGKEEL
jgi:inorganic pyrophosphatase